MRLLFQLSDVFYEAWLRSWMFGIRQKLTAKTNRSARRQSSKPENLTRVDGGHAPHVSASLRSELHRSLGEYLIGPMALHIDD